jgi:hypothetical protein
MVNHDLKSSPGDKIIFTADIVDQNDYFTPICITRNSTGVILTIEEYIAVDKDFKDLNGRVTNPDNLKEYLEKYNLHPVRLVTIVSECDSKASRWKFNCVAGSVHILNGDCFRVIERKKG